MTIDELLKLHEDTCDGEVFRQSPQNSNYAVSNRGRVMRIAKGRGAKVGRILRVSVCNSGYECVTLYENDSDRTHMVHRLVAEAWIGPVPEKADVNHLDGNKRNNASDNLEYVTRSENQRHAYANGMNRFVEVQPRLSDCDRQSIANSTGPAALVADKFGVTVGYVYTLRRNGLSKQLVG